MTTWLSLVTSNTQARNLLMQAVNDALSERGDYQASKPTGVPRS